jgi:hypothetical protein
MWVTCACESTRSSGPRTCRVSPSGPTLRPTSFPSLLLLPSVGALLTVQRTVAMCATLTVNLTRARFFIHTSNALFASGRR